MTSRSRPSDNWLLAALDSSEYARLLPHLERVELEVPRVLFEVNKPIEYVYFPETAVASLVGLVSEGSAVEVATVGREGVVGLPVFLGAGRMPARCFIQISGRGLRMNARAFREQSQQLPGLHGVMERYTQAMFTLISQAAACNRAHSTKERCARWLLMSEDRVGQSTFSLTQQFLALMLGVRRASVSQVASVLQDEGLLRYSRGQITVLDREGLETAACECYGLIQREFTRLLGRRHKPRRP